MMIELTTSTILHSPSNVFSKLFTTLDSALALYLVLSSLAAGLGSRQEVQGAA